MTREELITWVTARGYRPDRWGHLHKGNYRLKLSRIAVRHEVRSGAGWVRLFSAYYKDLSITPEGKLAGLKRGGCAAESSAAAPSQTTNPQTTKEGAEQ